MTLLPVNVIVFFLLIVSFAVFPVLPATGPEPVVHILIAVIILVPVLVFFVRVGLTYKSMRYELREDEMIWKRGVLFRTTGIVPYNRITR